MKKITGRQVITWIIYGALFAWVCYSILKCADDLKPQYTEPEIIEQNK